MSLFKRLEGVKEQIRLALIQSKRAQDRVLLLAVSKQQSIESIIEAHKLGICDFAENYWQEAHTKMEKLQGLSLCWHFIGPIQGNKAKAIAAHFDWVHSIDRFEIAKKLSDHRSPILAPLNVCLQINLMNEKSKSGVSIKEAATLAKAISCLPHLRLRGLMTIPPAPSKEGENYPVFIQLRQLMNDINQQLELNMDTLSMGMSDDFVSAIHAGATIVRIGQAIFGERQKRQ